MRYQVRKCNCAKKKKLAKVQYSPLDGTNGGVDLTWRDASSNRSTRRITLLKQTVSSWVLLGIQSVLPVFLLTVKQLEKISGTLVDTKLIIRVMLFAITYSKSRGKGRNE